MAFLPAVSIAERPETPHDQVAVAGNRFQSLFVRWAEAFNRMKPGTIDAGELAAWEMMPALFRKLERARTDWIRGTQCKTLKKNLFTTLAGLISLAFTGFQVYNNPKLLLDPATDAKVAAGVGLIAAADAKPTDPSASAPITPAAGK